MKPFRIDTIRLDEDEEVAGVTVVIDAPYLKNINDLVYDGADKARVVRKERGDTELWVELAVGEMLTLFRVLGSMTGGADAGYIPGGYASLTLVVYRLMED